MLKFRRIKLLIFLAVISCGTDTEIRFLEDCHDIRRNGEFVVDYYVIKNPPSETEEIEKIVLQFNSENSITEKIKSADHYVQVFFKETSYTNVDFSCAMENKKENRIQTHMEDRLLQVSWRGDENKPDYTFYDQFGFPKK